MDLNELLGRHQLALMRLANPVPDIADRDAEEAADRYARLVHEVREPHSLTPAVLSRASLLRMVDSQS